MCGQLGLEFVTKPSNVCMKNSNNTRKKGTQGCTRNLLVIFHLKEKLVQIETFPNKNSKHLEFSIL